MTMAVADSYRLITYRDDEDTERISVFGINGAEICGAFKPASRPYWLLYVSAAVAEVAGRPRSNPIPPRLQLRCRQDARKWVELIAGLYVRSATR
jgi:hypothetical protein